MTRRYTHAAARTLVLCAAVAALSGCATKGFVRKEIAGSEARIAPQTEAAANAARDAQSLAQTGDEHARQAQREAQMAHDLALGNIKREEVRKVTVNFAFDSAKLTDDIRTALDAVAEELKTNVNYMGLVSGYTDATGSEEYNLGLAQRRANSVNVYMAQKLGNDFVRLATIGFGEIQPVADNTSKEGRKENRRVEVMIVKPAPINADGTAPTALR